MVPAMEEIEPLFVIKDEAFSIRIGRRGITEEEATQYETMFGGHGTHGEGR